MPESHGTGFLFWGGGGSQNWHPKKIEIQFLKANINTKILPTFKAGNQKSRFNFKKIDNLTCLIPVEASAVAAFPGRKPWIDKESRNLRAPEMASVKLWLWERKREMRAKREMDPRGACFQPDSETDGRRQEYERETEMRGKGHESERERGRCGLRAQGVPGLKNAT